MNSSTTMRTPAPDATARTRELIELGLALDSEARSETLARLIAGSIRGGPDTALARFASTGAIEPEMLLRELNALTVPFEQEGWVDALGRYVLLKSGGGHERTRTCPYPRNSAGCRPADA